MYSKIVSNIEQGRFSEKPPNNELFERLYEERKTWSKPRNPQQFKIRTFVNEASVGRNAMHECFKNLKLKKAVFDPTNPKEFYKEKYTGGPTSNIMKESEIDF